MKLKAELLLIYLGLIFLISCQQNSSQKSETILVTDMLGRKVEVPKIIKKVVGVKAGALRMLSYLGAKDMIAGVEEIEKENLNPYNFANPQYADLPSIGPRHGGDAELIAMANPDIIFMTYATLSEADKLQNKTNIPVIAIEYGDLSKHRETFYKGLRLMANIINKTQTADSLIQFIDSTIADLEKQTNKIVKKQTPSIYAGGISFRGAHGILSTAPDFPPFEYLNVKNLAAPFESANNNVTIDKEQLIEWDPDKIFIDYAGWSIVQEELKEEALSQSLSAVQNNDLFLLLPYNWYTTNFATVLVDSYYAGSVLFPDAFSDINIQYQANRIYNAFLHKPVFHDMTLHFKGLERVILNSGGNVSD